MHTCRQTLWYNPKYSQKNYDNCLCAIKFFKHEHLVYLDTLQILKQIQTTKQATRINNCVLGRWDGIHWVNAVYKKGIEEPEHPRIWIFEVLFSCVLWSKRKPHATSPEKLGTCKAQAPKAVERGHLKTSANDMKNTPDHMYWHVANEKIMYQVQSFSNTLQKTACKTTKTSPATLPHDYLLHSQQAHEHYSNPVSEHKHKNMYKIRRRTCLSAPITEKCPIFTRKLAWRASYSTK